MKPTSLDYSISEIKLTYSRKVKAADIPEVTNSDLAYRLFRANWNDMTINLFEEFKILLLSRRSSSRRKSFRDHDTQKTSPQYPPKADSVLLLRHNRFKSFEHDRAKQPSYFAAGFSNASDSGTISVVNVVITVVLGVIIELFFNYI